MTTTPMCLDFAMVAVETHTRAMMIVIALVNASAGNHSERPLCSAFPILWRVDKLQ